MYKLIREVDRIKIKITPINDENNPIVRWSSVIINQQEQTIKIRNQPPDG